MMDLIFKDSNADEDLRSQVDTDDPLVMRAVLSHLGRRLATARIRQRAIDKQILMPTEPASAEDIAMLIFRSGFIEGEGGHIEIRFLDEHEGANFRAFETLIYLPDKYAASPDAAMSFKALRARALAGIGPSTQAA